MSREKSIKNLEGTLSKGVSDKRVEAQLTKRLDILKKGKAIYK